MGKADGTKIEGALVDAPHHASLQSTVRLHGKKERGHGRCRYFQSELGCARDHSPSRNKCSPAAEVHSEREIQERLARLISPPQEERNGYRNSLETTTFGADHTPPQPSDSNCLGR